MDFINDLNDRAIAMIGDGLRALPPAVANLIAFGMFVGMGLIFVWALVTPDSICVGCP